MASTNLTPTFNLKAVVRETGLKPDTLRAWERRYGLPQPRRSGGGHRLYSERDIEALKWLAARQAEGLSISRAVELWRRLEANGEDPLASPAYPMRRAFLAQPLVAGGEGLDEMRRAWVSACLAYDESLAEGTLAEAFALFPVESVCVHLLQAGLALIGDGWYAGKVSVQQEHFASALAQRRVEALLALAAPPIRPGKVLVACPPEEQHSFAPLLITLLLRRRGWSVAYLGANVPLNRLEEALAGTQPDLVIAAAQRLHTAATLLPLAKLMRVKGLRLAFGGYAFNHEPGLRDRIPGHFLGESLEPVPLVVERLLDTRGPVPEGRPAPASYPRALQHFLERQADLEARVWEERDRLGVTPAQLSEANQNLGQTIAAGLALGDMALLGSDIDWLFGLLGNHRVATAPLRRTLTAYRVAAAETLKAPGEPILDWLVEVAGPESSETS